jgi:hypothetical protein
LNELAKSVPWATPVADGGPFNHTLAARRRKLSRPASQTPLAEKKRFGNPVAPDGQHLA